MAFSFPVFYVGGGEGHGACQAGGHGARGEFTSASFLTAHGWQLFCEASEAEADRKSDKTAAQALGRSSRAGTLGCPGAPFALPHSGGQQPALGCECAGGCSGPPCTSVSLEALGPAQCEPWCLGNSSHLFAEGRKREIQPVLRTVTPARAVNQQLCPLGLTCL